MPVIWEVVDPMICEVEDPDVVTGTPPAARRACSKEPPNPWAETEVEAYESRVASVSSPLASSFLNSSSEIVGMESAGAEGPSICAWSTEETADKSSARETR